ncbi:MAG: hypothetical protein AAFV72_06510 [Cyanobacteria bacterium J06635_1]
MVKIVFWIPSASLYAGIKTATFPPWLVEGCSERGTDARDSQAKQHSKNREPQGTSKANPKANRTPCKKVGILTNQVEQQYKPKTAFESCWQSNRNFYSMVIARGHLT